MVGRGLNEAAYRMGARGEDWPKLFRALDINHDKTLSLAELTIAVRRPPIEVCTGPW